MDSPATVQRGKFRRWAVVLGVLALTGVAVGAVILPVVENMREASDRAKWTLAQLTIAMHNYASTHDDQLPPAAVRGTDGKPLLSWRVLILPYIEQQKLFEAFHLDEPWDSPRNLALLPRMPATYAAPGRKRGKLPEHHTVCHVFLGKGTLFDENKVMKIGMVPDGTSNTILLVEAGKPVPWTKPEELVFDPAGPLPSLDPIFKNGFRVGMADGSTRWIFPSVSEATLRSAIQCDDGKALGSDW